VRVRFEGREVLGNQGRRRTSQRVSKRGRTQPDNPIKSNVYTKTSFLKKPHVCSTSAIGLWELGTGLPLTLFVCTRRTFRKVRIMSNLSTLVGGWIAFNAALLAALYFRRPNPKLRAKLVNWVVRGSSQQRSRRLYHFRSRA
jgi:hypothetical protein